MSQLNNCPHGRTPYDETVVDDAGITACCAAYSSIFADDGTEYCKCCFGAVSGGAETPRIMVRLP